MPYWSLSSAKQANIDLTFSFIAAIFFTFLIGSGGLLFFSYAAYFLAVSKYSTSHRGRRGRTHLHEN